MQIKETKAEGLNREYTLVIPAKTIADKIERRLEEVGKTAKVAGFRPGKIPMPLLRQRYEGSVKGEVLEKTLDEGVEEVLRQKELRPALQPTLDIASYEDGKDLSCTIKVELLPELEPISLEQYSFERLTVPVDEKLVDERVQTLAERVKTPEPVAEGSKSKKGHQVRILFRGTLDGVAFPGGSSESSEFEIGAGQLLPDFENQLVGMKVGEKKDFQMTFPENYGARELAGKEVSFHVEMLEINALALPSLDDAFAKKFNKENMVELRKACADIIENEYKDLTRLDMKRKILDHFAEKFTFELPKGLVDLEFDSIWKQAQRDLHQGHNHGPDEECSAKPQTDKETKAMEKEYRALSERRVRLGLVLAEIGRANGVQVSQHEMEMALYKLAQQYPGHEKKVFEQFSASPRMQASLRAPIFEEKVIDVILDKCKIKEKKVTLDQLNARIAEITDADDEL